MKSEYKLHVSDLNHMDHCPRMAWNILQRKDRKENYANRICPFADLYLPYLQAVNWQKGVVNDTPEHSMEILNQDHKGVNLRFSYRGVRTTIPVLKQKEDGTYLAIYPIATCSPREKELRTFALNQAIAAKWGVDISEHQIVFLNKNYVKGNTEDIPLLQTSACLMKKSGRFFEQTIDEQLDAIKLDLDLEIDQGLKMLEDKPQPLRCRNCSAPRKCAWYEDCFKEGDHEDDCSLFLSNSASRISLYEDGITTLDQIPSDKIEGTPVQYAQIQAAADNGLFMDASAVSSFLGQISYPCIYLDFEWDTFLFPPYDGMKPFDVLAFQYSMHVEEKDGTIRHYNFFEEGDCREDFICSLLSDIPSKGSVIVYNMEGAEKLRLQQLAKQFPKYEKQLEQIWKRMIDLSVIFEQGSYYDIRQKGKYSLKHILPLFTKENPYEKLEVRDGLEAIFAYRKASSAKDESVKEEIGRQISAYCAMDTEAEIHILHGLQDKLKAQD